MVFENEGHLYQPRGLGVAADSDDITAVAGRAELGARDMASRARYRPSASGGVGR